MAKRFDFESDIFEYMAMNGDRDRLIYGASDVMEQVKEATFSDFAALGIADMASRRIKWHNFIGATNDRTLLVEQKLDIGLSGAAIRSGRNALMNAMLAYSDRFKLNEPLLLTESLLIAAALPIVDQRRIEKTVKGVLLIGRRTAESYRAEELDYALLSAERISSLL